MPEPITKQVDASKNDCEKTALKRLLSNISREHPHLKLLLNFDNLYSDGPIIKLVKSYSYRFIMVAKDTSHPALYESVDDLDKADKVKRYQYTDEKGYQHWFKFVNDAPINKSHQATLVNYLEYVEIDPKGNKYVNTWVTDIQLTQENVAKVMRGGRAKWKIEDEKFPKGQCMGLDVEWPQFKGWVFRLVVRWNDKKQKWVFIVTNLDRAEFTLSEVLQAYRLRWQIELIFKEINPT